MEDTNSAVFPPTDLPTLTDVLSFHALHNATLPWMVFPSVNDPTKLDDVSYGEIDAASTRVAHMLRPGRHGPDGEVVALILHTDTILYVAVVFGSFKAGLAVSFSFVDPFA